MDPLTMLMIGSTVASGAGALGGLLGGGGESVNYQPSKYNAWINKALKKRGLYGSSPLMQGSLDQLGAWMNYDPTLNPVTGTGSITGSGMGAILDALARNSYQNVEGAINKQANVGREAAIDELSRRGIVTSSEAPASMSVLESQRLDQIRNAAQNIEAQRLQGQLAIPGMLQGIGAFGAGEQQRQIGNIFSQFGLAGQLAGGGMQAQAMNANASAQAGYNNMMAGNQLGNSLGSLFALWRQNQQQNPNVASANLNAGSALANVPTYDEGDVFADPYTAPYYQYQ